MVSKSSSDSSEKPQINRHGDKLLISGNEAIFEALVDAGVGFGSIYPGTPVSEVGDLLYKQAKDGSNLVFDYAVNEKVSLESAIGAAWTGIRSVCIFKHLGMNIAADPLHSIMYSGINGSKGAGMVIVCGGDPQSSSSTNAADIRMYSMHTHLPIICPSSIQELYDFTKIAFAMSEEIDLPVMIYTTSKLSFATGILNKKSLSQLKSINKPPSAFSAATRFCRNRDRFINAIHFAIRNQKHLLDKIETLKTRRIDAEAEISLWNYLLDDIEQKEITHYSSAGIITSGIPYLYVREVLSQMDVAQSIPVLKLNQIYPVNENQIIEFVVKYAIDTIIVIEELEPFIENQIKSILFNEFSEQKVYGKPYIPRAEALNHRKIYQGIISALETDGTVTKSRHDDFCDFDDRLSEILSELPIREPTFCPGCSHRNVFYTLRKIADNLLKTEDIDVIFGGDIGCYTMGMSPPYSAMDWLISMGAGVGIANGVGRVLKRVQNADQRIVALIGDSTFFHTGMQGLLNVLKENLPITVIILNNYYVAMTGHQPTLTSDPRLQKTETQYGFQNKQFPLPEFLRHMGVQNLTILDGYDIPKMNKKLTKIIKNQSFLQENSKRTEVIVINAECALMQRRDAKEKWNLPRGKQRGVEKYLVISETCPQCHECYIQFGCTAIKVVDDPDRGFKYIIDESACMKEYCEACLDVCPNDSIGEILVWTDKDKEDTEEGL